MIDLETLDPGSLVRVRFSYGEGFEDAVFLGLDDSEGPLMAARFCQADTTRPGMFTWRAFLTPSGWVCGAGEIRLDSVSVVPDFEF